MKRVREFEVAEFKHAPSDKKMHRRIARCQSARLWQGCKSSSKPLESWHASCDFAEEQLREGKDNCVIVFDQQTKRAAACFSLEDMSLLTPQNAQSDEQPYEKLSPVWQSRKIGVNADGMDVFENRNIRDFHWDQIEGARRDLPFRLGLLERLCERYLFIAYPVGLFYDFRNKGLEM